MDDWKTRVDYYREEESRKDAEKKKREEEKARREVEREEARKKAEKAAILANHQRRVFCHTCGKPSSGPKREFLCVAPRSDLREPVENVYWTNWDNSSLDLNKCLGCNHWFCEEHIYWGFCQKCAKKLKKPR